MTVGRSRLSGCVAIARKGRRARPRRRPPPTGLRELSGGDWSAGRSAARGVVHVQNLNRGCFHLDDTVERRPVHGPGQALPQPFHLFGIAAACRGVEPAQGGGVRLRTVQTLARTPGPIAPAQPRARPPASAARTRSGGGGQEPECAAADIVRAPAHNGSSSPSCGLSRDDRQQAGRSSGNPSALPGRLRRRDGGRRSRYQDTGLSGPRHRQDPARKRRNPARSPPQGRRMKRSGRF